MKAKSVVLASILAISSAAFAQSADTNNPDARVGVKGPRADGVGGHGGHEGKSITREQAMNKAGEHFDRLDTNKDGVIDAEERKAAHEKMRAMHEKRKGERHGKGMDAPAPAK